MGIYENPQPEKEENMYRRYIKQNLGEIRKELNSQHSRRFWDTQMNSNNYYI